MSTTATAALPSSLASLLSKYGSGTNTTADSSSHRAPKSTGGRLGADPAFTLSLSTQDTSAALVGYNRLAKLGDAFETEVAKLETTPDAATTAKATSAAKTVTVTVSQLAQAQSLATSPIGNPDKASLGTGTLTIQLGTFDAASNSFTAGSSAQAVSIPITGGTLDDIASSINAAKAGVTAQVVEEGGGYALHLTASATGAGNAFALSGLSELTYNPASPDASPLVTTSEAQDAHFSVGGKEYASASNSNVPVAIGTRANFTEIGTLTVATSDAAARVESLTNTFNAMQKAIIAMASKDGDLEKDANLAAGLFKSLDDAATATVETTGSVSSLAQIGVTLQSDGTLKIDPTKLDAAITQDADGVQSLISQIATTIGDAVQPYTGSNGSLKSQVTLLGTLATRGGPTLLDYINGTDAAQSASSSGGLASLLGGDSTTGSLGTASQSDLATYLAQNATGSDGTMSQSDLADYLAKTGQSTTADLSALFR